MNNIDYNEIYDTYLEGKELKEAEPTKLDDIVKVDPNKKEITYPKQDKNDPRKPSDITKDELLNSDKNEKELPSTEDGTAKKEIQDMLDRSWNRKHNIGIENEDYWKDREAGKCYKCGKIIPDGEKYIIDGQQYCLDCKGDAEQELLDQSELERNIDNFNDYDESKTIKEDTEFYTDEETKITLDDIANKASELGYEILGDERDDEGLTILVYKPESAETDNFDDFDNEELYSYLSTIPNVRYQIDNDDQSCLAIWLKESKKLKEDEASDTYTNIIKIINPEDEKWYDKLYQVSFIVGNYSIDYKVYANDTQQALEQVVAYMENSGKTGPFTDETVEKIELDDTKTDGEIRDEIENNYIYVDGTEYGALQPHYIDKINLDIHECLNESNKILESEEDEEYKESKKVCENDNEIISKYHTRTNYENKEDKEESIKEDADLVSNSLEELKYKMNDSKSIKVIDSYINLIKEDILKNID